MHILALNAFHSGSHQAFLDGWSRHSRHRWTTLTLPGCHWKWRMRHAAQTFGDWLAPENGGDTFDLIYTTDMLDVPALRGFLPPRHRNVPILCYFHENQLTYPWREDRERDHHYGVTNILSALAADALWFNSAFHRDDFFEAADALLRRMPDFAPLDALRQVRLRAKVQHPGIDAVVRISENSPTIGPRPFHICWAARWEHDKNPRPFFNALESIRSAGISIELSVLGQRFADSPPCFEEARPQFSDVIRHWGFLPRQEYLQALSAADCFVSTATHEFFGIAAVEAMASGCVPVFPDRLAYPELLGDALDPKAWCLFDGSVDGLIDRIKKLVSLRTEVPEKFASLREQVANHAAQFYWHRRAADMDAAAEII